MSDVAKIVKYIESPKSGFDLFDNGYHLMDKEVEALRGLGCYVGIRLAYTYGRARGFRAAVSVRKREAAS